MADFTELDGDVEPENIWTASSDGDLNRVRELIESGVSVNAQVVKTEYFKTPNVDHNFYFIF